MGLKPGAQDLGKPGIWDRFNSQLPTPVVEKLQYAVVGARAPLPPMKIEQVILLKPRVEAHQDT